MPQIESGNILNSFIKATGNLVEDALRRLAPERRRRIETLIESNPGQIEFTFSTDPFHLTCSLSPVEDFGRSSLVLFKITLKPQPPVPNSEATRKRNWEAGSEHPLLQAVNS